jgi:quercetin dioxygenase-like cupin family protein
MAVRRVVTGVDEQGRSHVVSDSAPPCILATAGSKAPEVVYVWTTDAVPDAPNSGTDPTRVDQEFLPGPSGSRLMIMTYPAGFGVEPPDPAVGTEMTSTDLAMTYERVLMHRTTTVDYGIVLTGEMTMLLDSGEELTLRPTDVIVQNGAVHGWRNASDAPSVVAFVMIGAHDPANRS